MTLDQLFNHGADAARLLFKRQGEIHPMWITEDKDGAIVPYLVPLERDKKTESMMALKQLFKERNIVRYVSMLESWAIEVKELPESFRRGASLASHPDRREIVALLAEDKDGTYITGQLFILRPEHGKPKLSDLKITLKSNEAGAELSGRFVGLLSK